jgi:hypothetical protein
MSSRKASTIVDRRVLLRMPLALRKRHHGQEKGATRIEQHLKPVTLDMVTSTTMIEYVLFVKPTLELPSGGS